MSTAAYMDTPRYGPMMQFATTSIMTGLIFRFLGDSLLIERVEKIHPFWHIIYDAGVFNIQLSQYFFSFINLYLLISLPLFYLTLFTYSCIIYLNKIPFHCMFFWKRVVVVVRLRHQPRPVSEEFHDQQRTVSKNSNVRQMYKLSASRWPHDPR